MVLYSCRLHHGAAVVPQGLPVWGHSCLRFAALQRLKLCALGPASWRHGISPCRKKHLKPCRAESVTAESQPIVPDPSEETDAPESPPAKPLDDAVIGEAYTGKVISILKYGAFVDIGFEKDAFIHISQITDSFVSDIGDILKKGEEIECVVLSKNIEERTLRARLKSFTAEKSDSAKKITREFKKDPPFQVGDEVSATVFRVNSWGVFVSLPDGYSGLLHVSELDEVRNSETTGELPNAMDYLSEGDDLTLRVLKIEDGKVSLTQMTADEMKETAKMKESGLIAGNEEELPHLFRLMFDTYGISRDHFSSLPEGASLSYDESDHVELSNDEPLGETSALDSQPEAPKALTSEKPGSEQDSKVPELSADNAETAATPAMVVSAKMVKELRDISGAGMMDCKKALTEAQGDMAEADAYLKKKGITTAAKKAGRIAAEGAIGAYIHTGSRLGVLVEVNCETDFVARSPEFKELVEDMAMQVAASEAICVSVDDFPEDVLEREKQIELAKEDLQSKPEAIREKIVTGRLDKLRKSSSLLEQAYVKDTSKTVSEVITSVVAKLGENISVRQFEKYVLGEGLEKRGTDFAAEVAEQTEKKASAVKEEAPKDEHKEEPQDEPDVSDVVVSAQEVKELRLKSGAGMMDCKKALQKCNGNMEEAEVYLKVKGMAVADKKAGRIASEGNIAAYIHTGARLGVLAEINCETDFVARGDIFKELVEDMCMQIAAFPDVLYVRQGDIPTDVLDKEREIEMNKEDLQNKPEQVREKMVEGRLQKYAKLISLMDQPYIKDNNKTVEEVVKEAVGSIGENIQIRRFSRFNLGEGLQKRSDDFAAEVAAQTKRE